MSQEFEYRWDQYAADVISGEIVAGLFVRQACERHFDDMENGPDRGLYFDVNQAEVAVEFFERILKHSKGRWAGQPFILSPWQAFLIGSLFGWYREDGTRRFNNLYLEVARKNGKTQIGAGLGCKFLDFDGEEAAEVYFAATKRDQARIGYDEAKRMCEKSPFLKRRVKSMQKGLFVSETNSIAKPLSSDYGTLDGLSVLFALVDEYHAHPNAEILNVLTSGTGARENPLVAVITTAGFNLNSPCLKMRKAATEVLKGVKTDDSTFALIYTIDKDDDWKDSTTWIKANPNLGITFDLTYLEKRFKTAQNEGGAAVNNFKTKHLNIWVQSDENWIEDEVWMTNAVDFDPGEGASCWMGLDLASTSDITALSAVFPTPDGYHFKNWYFIPEAAIERRLNRDDADIYGQFAELPNVIVTPGNVCDYAAIRKLITGTHIIDGKVDYSDDCLANRYDIVELARDSWNSSQISIDLVDDGIRVVPYRQGFASLSAPTKEVERLTLQGGLTHDGDPVTRWMIGNVKLNRDPAGNIKPDKEKSSDKIDGVAALVMGIGQHIKNLSTPDDALPADFGIRST